jgi:hypothetical protein
MRKIQKRWVVQLYLHECNFKNNLKDGYQCVLGIRSDAIEGGLMMVEKCPGEDMCVLFQIYKKLSE